MANPIPRGVEVLVRKASVDPAFKDLLLTAREAAASQIDLELTPAEAAVLRAVPAGQLEAMIGRTSVPAEHRRAFLGHAAAAMLAALGATVIGPHPASGGGGFGGIQPGKDRPQEIILEGGSRPPRESPGPKPDPKAPSVEDRVIGLVAKQFKLDTKEVTREKALVADLKANAGALVRLRKALEQEFKIKIPGDAFKKLRTVGEVVTHIEKAVENRTAPAQAKPVPPRGVPVGGIRPDRPPAGGLGGMRP